MHSVIAIRFSTEGEAPPTSFLNLNGTQYLRTKLFETATRRFTAIAVALRQPFPEQLH